MNPLKKLAGQTAVYGLPTIIGRLLNYLLVPLYTRAFITSEYGVVTEFYAYVAFLFVILTYGMETAFFRFSSSEQNKSHVFSTALISLIVSSVLFLILAFAFAPSISFRMGYSEHTEYIRWFALVLATDAISTIPYANLRLKNKPLRFAFIKIVNIAANIGFNLFFILLCPYLMTHFPNSSISSAIETIYNPAIGVGYIFISNLIASVLTFAMLLPEIIRINFKIDFNLLKRMLKYSWPLLIFGMAGIVNETFDRVILKYLLPSHVDAMAQLGIYGACYKVSILMTLFIQTYRYAAEPFFFDQAGQKDAKKTYANMMHYFIIVCLLIFLGIMLYIDIVIRFIGKDFREGAGVIPILLAANLCLGIFYNLSVWFKLTDHTKTGALISLAGAGITIILNFILIPSMGYMGAAWATLACYASMMALSYVIGQKYYPVDYHLSRAAIYSLIATLIFVASVMLSNQNPWLKYAINTLLMAGFIMYIFRVEKQRFLSVIRKA